MYWWADGVHFNVRLEEDRLCCLVIVGVRPDGSKELIALADGYREDTESWLDLLRGLKQRGLDGPSLAVGDGALGFWGALRDVFPAAKEQRCWVHVTANVLAALPKRLQADAKTAMAKIYSAPTRADACRYAPTHTDTNRLVPTRAGAHRRAPIRAEPHRRVPTSNDSHRRAPADTRTHRRALTLADTCRCAPT